MHKIIYIGCVDNENVGEKLMLESFINLFNRYLDSTKYLLKVSNPDNDLFCIDEYDSIVLGGGALLIDKYIDILYSAVVRNKNILVWGCGYDLADKNLLHLIEHSKMPPYLYSYLGEEKLQDIIRHSNYFGVRGPLTYKLLQKTVIDSSKVFISGDPGFLLEPKNIETNSPIEKFSPNDKIIAINWGTTLNKMYGDDETTIENTLVSICNSLIDSGYKIYIYPLENKDINPCTNLCNKIKNDDFVALDDSIRSGGQLLNILSKCYFSINLKLHANIISAVSSTPFICLGHRFECFDFVKSINCEDLLVSTDSESFECDILAISEYIHQNYPIVARKIFNNVKDFKNILETPFKEDLFKVRTEVGEFQLELEF
ncbi:MAG: polysaccharide pyruvyl transferase family protein [Romboutsia sp.]|uniref:polysaccharide pyruvyl transferase family protein n=1 Tax=Romboutsia sp. TaxID=1965302 RepID=UPI003F40207E